MSTSGLILSLLLRVFRRTYRWHSLAIDAENGQYTDHEIDWMSCDPTILAFWHGQQLFMPWSFRTSRCSSPTRTLNALISLHGDGRIAADAVRRLGIQSVGGSSTRGGREALLAMRRLLRAGHHIAITPDGPKGPIFEAKDGVITLAQITGARILPAAIGARRYWNFRSWDKMMLPKPFSKTVLLFGPPLYIPKGSGAKDTAEYARVLSESLNRLTERAQQIANRK